MIEKAHSVKPAPGSPKYARCWLYKPDYDSKTASPPSIGRYRQRSPQSHLFEKNNTWNQRRFTATASIARASRASSRRNGRTAAGFAVDCHPAADHYFFVNDDEPKSVS